MDDFAAAHNVHNNITTEDDKCQALVSEWKSKSHREQSQRKKKDDITLSPLILASEDQNAMRQMFQFG